MKKYEKFKLVIISLLIPTTVEIGLSVFNINIFSNDSWLGFWGSYLGAIIAVVGVWWQTNKTIENEKELMFSNARPFFNLTIERKVPELGKLYVCEKTSEIKV
ncbi:hypothetical protein HZI56_02530, partial [Lactobacillus salivarius]|nr:hypothetical protein [Ligilactobacillus salivarius]